MTCLQSLQMMKYDKQIHPETDLKNHDKMTSKKYSFTNSPEDVTISMVGCFG